MKTPKMPATTVPVGRLLRDDAEFDAVHTELLSLLDYLGRGTKQERA